MSIEKRIKIAREKAKMSQDELAEAIGMTKNSVQRYEKDAKGLTVKALIKISEITREDPTYIMYGEAKEMNLGARMARMIMRLEGYDDDLKKEIINIAEALMLKKHAEKIRIEEDEQKAS